MPPQSSHSNITSTCPHLSARLSVCNGQNTEEGGDLGSERNGGMGQEKETKQEELEGEGETGQKEERGK